MEDTTATPISARCHLSWKAVSATDSEKRWRMPSTMGLTTARFSFSDRAAGMCSSMRHDRYVRGTSRSS